jgi:hypothetical protein
MKHQIYGVMICKTFGDSHLKLAAARFQCPSESFWIFLWIVALEAYLVAARKPYPVVDIFYECIPLLIAARENGWRVLLFNLKLYRRVRGR